MKNDSGPPAESSAPPRSEAAGELSRKRQLLVLLAVAAGMFILVLDSTVNVALPAVARDFGVAVPTVQFLVVAYLASRTAVALGAGSAADRYGLRRFFMLGTAINMTAVVLIALSPDLYAIFGLRVLQAAGAGIGAAVGPALAGRAFPPEQRGRALGVITSSMAAGMIIGSLGGGFLVDALGWRSVFWVRVPFAVVALLLAALALPEFKAAREERRGFDLAGAVGIFVSLGCFLLALSLGSQRGWMAPSTLGLFAAGAVLAFWVYRVEGRVAVPVLDLGLLRNGTFAATFLVMFFGFMGMLAVFLLFPFYMSNLLGHDATTIGVMMATMAVVMSLSSPVSGWISDRVSPRVPIVFGPVVSAVGMIAVAQLGHTATLTSVALALAISGVGFGFTQSGTYAMTLKAIPWERFGTASAVLAVAQGLGGSIGAAVVSAIFAARTAAYGEAVDPGSPNFDPALLATVFRDSFGTGAAFAVVAILAGMLTFVVRKGGRKAARPKVPS